MTLASDGIVFGQPIISGAHFAAPSFVDNFTSLDIPTGTDHLNTGVWSDQIWPNHIGIEGNWWEDWVPNDESQKYVTTFDPTPDNWSPFTITPEGLQIRGEEVPGGDDHQEWSFKKSYDFTAAGVIKTTDDYPGWPNINIPNTTIPATPSDYSLERQNNGTTRVFWLNFPARWRSGIINGRNRRSSITQGRLAFVIKWPAGAFDTGGGRSRDFRSCTFPAAWGYGNFSALRNRNDQPRQNHGLYPYNEGGSLNEFDVVELGGAQLRRIYHAIHAHNGAGYNFNQNFYESDLDRSRASHIADFDPTEEFLLAILDITPEKVGFAFSRFGEVPTYTRVTKTFRAWHETKRFMLTDPNNDRVVVRNSEGQFVPIGEQLDDQGQPKLQEMMPIINMAFDGKWLLDGMDFNRDQEPPYDTYDRLPDGRRFSDMVVKHCSISPLINAQFSRMDGRLYQPYRDMAQATANPWDLSVTTPITTVTPTLTGFGGT